MPPQAVTNSQGVSTASPVSSQATQAESADAQAASASSPEGTNSQDVNAVCSQPQMGHQLV